MKRHYLKIPTTIAPWVPGGARGDWQGEIFHDVTGTGNEVVLEFLDRNDRGPISALHGEKFDIEIGRDRDRPDGVFVIRIQPATNPRRVPVRLQAQFVLWPGGNPAPLDSVDTLFNVPGRAGPEKPDRTPAPAEREQPPEEASPLVLTSLSSSPARLRSRLRPGANAAEPESVEGFLQPLRHVWARYRLDRYLEVSPRHETLLRTRITPEVLPRQERDALLRAFDFGLLNKLAVSEPQ